MFEELKRLISEANDTKVYVTGLAPLDDDGYIDRECPADGCKFAFKVHGEDWRAIVRDEEVFCPFCGHEADARKWWTTEQAENAKQQALAKLRGMVSEAVQKDAANFNRRQPRGGFLTMSMKVKIGAREIVMPVDATAPMRLQIKCETCACRHAVIGAAYFCPSCGHSAVDRVFLQSLGTIRSSLDALPSIRANITDPDVAENTARLVIEAGLQNIVTAFQRYAEVQFAKQSSPPKVRRNAFQNLDEGSRLWKEAFRVDYATHLDEAGIAELNRLFQQRHLLAHKEGIVDESYVAKSADASYRAGQRLVVKEGAVRRGIELVKTLGLALAIDVQPGS